MKKALVFVVTLLALTLAAAAAPKGHKHDLTLLNDTQVGGVTLKAGDYWVEVDGGTATFYRGSKAVAKTAVHAQDAGEKYRSTSVVYSSNGHALLEIRFGGGSSKLIVEGSAMETAGSGQ